MRASLVVLTTLAAFVNAAALYFDNDTGDASLTWPRCAVIETISSP
jgi:hypothetical protein